MVVSTLRKVVARAPPILNLGQLIKATTTPIKLKVWLMYDYLILYLDGCNFPLKHKAQIINEQTPLYRNTVIPPPPS